MNNHDFILTTRINGQKLFLSKDRLATDDPANALGFPFYGDFLREQKIQNADESWTKFGVRWEHGVRDSRKFDPVNLKLLADRLARFNAVPGPRVGDFIHLPRINPRQGEWTRITHDWGRTLQTGGMEGSYHFPGDYLSHSGGLDPGVDSADLVATDKTKPGSVWIFDRDLSGAGRGVTFTIPCRVFTLRPGARLDGLGELSCPFHLTCLDATGHARTCNYWYCISHHGTSHTAFTTEAELREWLAEERLVLAKPLPPHGEHACIGLDYE